MEIGSLLVGAILGGILVIIVFSAVTGGGQSRTPQPAARMSGNYICRSKYISMMGEDPVVDYFGSDPFVVTFTDGQPTHLNFEEITPQQKTKLLTHASDISMKKVD